MNLRSQYLVLYYSEYYQSMKRMLDMGLVPGAEVTVMRKAPLGDPVEYSIKGTAIAMRRTDAESIMVEEVRDG